MLLLLIAAAAMAAIIKGADWLVEGASGIALRAGMSKIVIGATIVSLGTTSPEAAVSVMAAWKGDAGLALGNAVGSIIADTGLIFGMGCLLMALPVDRFILNRQGWVQFGSAVLLAVICYVAWWQHREEPVIGRWVGPVMLGLLGAYLWASVRWGRQHSRLHAHEDDTSETDEILERASGDSWAKLALRFVVGLTLVVLFGHILIICVELLCLRWGVPEVVVASTIVALGTSLPELVVGITAIRKGHPELLIGNVIGADVLNVLFVIGASASAAELPIIDRGPDAPTGGIPEIFLYLHLPTMLVILTLFRVYIFAAVRRGRFLRWFGVPLVTIYLAYLALNYFLSMSGGGSTGT
ncbi:MAG: sodium:calcium antiporter [Planctomycetaceae bacterium]|nr:sodium:calcium antiporter [Planctomycetaceae bacterium]